ncbi:MAG: hypothetical protein R2854_20950 [Caldilineaceae bacterium]
MAALVVLAGVVWRTGRRRWLVVALLALAAWGVVALVYTPRLYAVTAPSTPVAADGLCSCGADRTGRGRAAAHLPVLVCHGDAARLLVAHWTLQRGGEPVATPAPTPIFNAATAADWPPGTLVDDAYRLPLPAAPPAGTYDLALTVGEDEASMPASVVAQVTFANDVQTGELPAPAQPVEARFGDAAPHRLRSHGAPLPSDAVARRDVGRARRGVPGLRALQWQADARIAANDHTFVHLVDRLGRPWPRRITCPDPVFVRRRSGAHSNESRMSFACGCRVRRRAALLAR